MAQATDYDQLQDPSLNDEEGGKTGFISKLKDKTKHTGRKLKSKLKPGSNNSDSTGDTGEGNYDDEEEDESPATQNAFSGQTQSAYDQKSGSDQTPLDTTGPTSAEPAQNFPGDFAGVADANAGSQPNADEEGLTKSFQGLSTNESTDDGDKPVTEKASDTLTSAKDQAKGTVSGGDNAESQYTSPDAPPATEQVGEQTRQLGDKASETGGQLGDKAGQLGDKASETGGQLGDKASETGGQLGDKASETGGQLGDKASQTTQQVGDQASETGKSWSQWAAEKVGYAKDTAAAKAPTTADGKPIHQAAYENAAGAKDSLAVHSDPNQIPSDPAQQSYVQKATGGIYGAKDSLYSATQPGEHDKALSQKVTETVGNLPATLKSYLPSGGKTASSDSSVSSTDEAAGAAPQSPSIVGRLTGLFGAKKPATEESPLSTESATSESGAEPTSTS